MQILLYLILSLVVVFGSITFSSQSDHSLDGTLIPGIPRNGTCSSLEQRYFPDKSDPPLESGSRSTAPSVIHPPVRFPATRPSSSTTFQSKPSPPSTRRIVPPTILPSNDGRIYGLEHLEYIRITSRKNLRRIFELRRYTFPADSKLKLRLGYHTYGPMTNEEQIVISTSDGEVYAILENTNFLAGIYCYFSKSLRTERSKINMGSAIVTPLTPEEVKETPVGVKRPISANYKINFVSPRPQVKQENID